MPQALRVLFLINPSAGRGQAVQTWKMVMDQLPQTGWDWSEYHSGCAGDLIPRAMAAAGESWDRIVILGGDGTVHEVVNGLLQSSQPASTLPALALIPCGSGNDWARTWKFPRHPARWFQEANQWTVQCHAAGTLSCQRDSQTSHSYFMNVAGLAYDAWLVKQIEDNPSSKGHALIYLWSILRNLLTYRPQQGEVTCGDRFWSGRFYTLNAGICPYSGGGMRVVPHADPAHHKLALTIAGDLPLSRILWNIWRFYTGSIGRVKEVDTLQATQLHVESRDPDPLYVEADGEWKGQCPCSIGIIPEAFRVWAPKRSA